MVECTNLDNFWWAMDRAGGGLVACGLVYYFGENAYADIKMFFQLMFPLLHQSFATIGIPYISSLSI